MLGFSGKALGPGSSGSYTSCKLTDIAMENQHEMMVFARKDRNFHGLCWFLGPYTPIYLTNLVRYTPGYTDKIAGWNGWTLNEDAEILLEMGIC